MQYLVLTLYAPLSSHGETGAARVRNSWTRPARSAVFGLIAGSLGIDRDDVAAQAALSNGYGYAVRVDAVGRSLVDWHTIIHPADKAGKNLRTRRGEVQHPVTGCIPTRREYRVEGTLYGCHLV